MPLDEDPLYVKNPDPYMDGDKQLFVINPKYSQTGFAQGVKVFTPYYDETPGPPATGRTSLTGVPLVPTPQQKQPCQVYTVPEGPTYGQTTKQTDWMTCISDNAPLGALSIPGTHNSLADTGGPGIQHQSWDIATQLHAGIRFLHLRLRVMNHQILFWNGPDNPPTSIHEFMKAITKFLSEHPRETILAHITDEAAGPTGNSDFYYHLHKTLNDNYGEYIFPLQLPSPTLGMARGKMVIIKDYTGGPPGGLEYSYLDTVEAMSLASPDDKDIRPKEKQFKDHLKKAMRSGDFSKIFVTVMHACGAGYPYQYSATINESLLFTLVKHPRGRVGIISMDFPAEHLITSIILRNFKQCKS